MTGGQNSADARDLSAAALVRVRQKPPILTQQGEVGFFDREFFSGLGRFSAQRDPVPEHEPTPPDPPLGPVDSGVELRKGRGTWRGGVLHRRAFAQFGRGTTPEPGIGYGNGIAELPESRPSCR